MTGSENCSLVPELSHKCETAEQLLDALGPMQGHWGKHPEAWCFRGQDGDYPLTPSALRSKARKPGSLLPPVSPLLGGLVEQFGPNHEYGLLNAFMKAADRAGLAIPHESPSLRGRRLSTTVAPNADYLGELKGWPPDEVLAILALAQHYGVPTRLLDWSYRPLVSAYFAAKDVAHAMWAAEHAAPHDPDLANPDGNVVVWALNTAWLDLLTDTLRVTNIIEHHLGPLARVTLVEAPQATNPNLSAQAGTFTLDRLAGVDARFNEDLVSLIEAELSA